MDRNSFLEVNDLDRLILLELTYDEIITLIINKNIQTIIDDDYFWCAWLDKHNINVSSNCKFLAKNISLHQFNFEQYHLTALENNDLNSVKLLYANKLASPDDLLIYDNEYQHPLIISVTNGYYELTKYLLTFKPDATKALDIAVKNKINVNIVKLLLYAGAKFTTRLMNYAVEHNNVEFIAEVLKMYNIQKPLFKTLLATALEQENTEILITLLSSSSNTMPYDFKMYYKKLTNKNIEHLRPLILRFLSL